jgi:hypothetical protein
MGRPVGTIDRSVNGLRLRVGQWNDEDDEGGHQPIPDLLLSLLTAMIDTLMSAEEADAVCGPPTANPATRPGCHRAKALQLRVAEAMTFAGSAATCVTAEAQCEHVRARQVCVPFPCVAPKGSVVGHGGSATGGGVLAGRGGPWT